MKRKSITFPVYIYLYQKGQESYISDHTRLMRIPRKLLLWNSVLEVETSSSTTCLLTRRLTKETEQGIEKHDLDQVQELQ